MYIDRDFFIYLIENPTPGLMNQLDRTLCGCNYCYHWVYQMQTGKYRPLINELDAELAQVHNTSMLYDFLKEKQKPKPKPVPVCKHDWMTDNHGKQHCKLCHMETGDISSFHGKHLIS